jgi:hypothetical protein|tara:strand:- start:28 stop:312 length:285 start_codon:yes stop_codon:yes gene_type:complete
MLEQQRRVFEKMIGIWSISKIPDLQMKVIGSGEVAFTCAAGPICKLKFNLFDKLVPLEVVELIESKLEEQYGINGKKYRADFRGYMADPFSSQR